eukprot:8247230-Pyramimonas_sp.AAC.1
MISLLRTLGLQIRKGPKGKSQSQSQSQSRSQSVTGAAISTFASVARAAHAPGTQNATNATYL